MDIEEVRKKRQELIDTILNEVDKFYSETGVMISTIRYDCIEMRECSGNVHPAIGSCGIELRI